MSQITPVRIRPAGPRARLASLQLRREVFVQELGLDHAVVFDDREDESLHVVALAPDGSVVGCARLLVVMGDDDLETAWGQWLAVRPALRRQGIGAGLLSALESEALRRGLDAVRLTPPAALVETCRREGYRGDGPELSKRLW